MIFFQIPQGSEIIILSIWLISLSIMFSVSIVIVTNGRVFIFFMAEFYICIYISVSVSVQLLSHVQLFVTPWTAACQASLSITNSWGLPKFMPTELVMPSDHLILCCLLLLLPSIFPNIRVFSNESVLHMRWPKCWSFGFNISLSNEHPRLSSFRMDCLDLLAVQGTLKSLFQPHSSKASILLCSAFFIAQLSHPYMTTGKTIALTRQNIVDKVMSLLFNMLSRLVITFLPRSSVPSKEFSSVQFSSVAQLCLTPCEPMNHRTPCLPVHHQLPESTQTHVHWVGGAIQPSHPLSSPFPPALNLSQHQGLFQWVSSSHQVAKVLEFQLQHQSSKLQSPSAVILEPPKIKSATVFTVSPSICHEVMGPDTMIIVFWMLRFKPTCSRSSFNFINRLIFSLP